MTDPSIICFGSVQGNFDKFLSKLQKATSKSNFTACICVDDFFGTKTVEDLVEYLDATCHTCPVPVYFLMNTPSRMIIDNSKNIFPLCEESGIVSFKGFRFAYLQGKWNYASKTQEENDDNGRMVDVLLSCELPSSLIRNYQGVQVNESEKALRSCKPRYCLAGSEEQSIETKLDISGFSCRFLSLTPLVASNTEKEGVVLRSYYAFKLPRESPPVERKRNAKEEDQVELYEQNYKKKRPDDSYTCNNCGVKGHFKADCLNPRKEMPCWFCLSNPDAEKHLVLFIANLNYVALPKGPLVDGHFLVVTIDHIPSYSKTKAVARDEARRMLGHLKDYYKNTGKELMFFESSYRSIHAVYQVIPIDPGNEVALEKFFKEKLAAAGLRMEEFIQKKHHDYVRVELPSGRAFYFEPNRKTDVQITRKILASFLNVENRSDWNACTRSVEEEVEDGRKYKSELFPIMKVMFE